MASAVQFLTIDEDKNNFVLDEEKLKAVLGQVPEDMKICIVSVVGVSNTFLFSSLRGSLPSQNPAVFALCLAVERAARPPSPIEWCSPGVVVCDVGSNDVHVKGRPVPTASSSFSLHTSQRVATRASPYPPLPSTPLERFCVPSPPAFSHAYDARAVCCTCCGQRRGAKPRRASLHRFPSFSQLPLAAPPRPLRLLHTHTHPRKCSETWTFGNYTLLLSRPPNEPVLHSFVCAF